MCGDILADGGNAIEINWLAGWLSQIQMKMGTTS